MKVKTPTTLFAALLCSTAIATAAWTQDSAGEPGRAAGGKNALTHGSWCRRGAGD